MGIQRWYSGNTVVVLDPDGGYTGGGRAIPSPHPLPRVLPTTHYRAPCSPVFAKPLNNDTTVRSKMSKIRKTVTNGCCHFGLSVYKREHGTWLAHCTTDHGPLYHGPWPLYHGFGLSAKHPGLVFLPKHPGLVFSLNIRFGLFSKTSGFGLFL